MQTAKETRYIPRDYVLIKESPKYVVYGDESRRLAIFYTAKATKHARWHNRFRTVEDMHKKIEQTINNIEAHEIRKKARAEERKQPHTLKVGDILYTSWGYEQTNVDFYQVTAVVGAHSVKIREIKQSCVRSEGHSDYVVPVPDAFKGEEELKRVQHGNYIRIASYASASMWEGRPVYQTALGWGH